MLSCMILVAIEVDARVHLVARIRHRAVSRCTRARLHALVHYFTRNLISWTLLVKHSLNACWQS